MQNENNAQHEPMPQHGPRPDPLATCNLQLETEFLCALASADELDPSEFEPLRLHLLDCPRCRKTLSEFQSVSGTEIPRIADAYAVPSTDIPEWDLEASKQGLFARLPVSSAAPEPGTARHASKIRPGIQPRIHPRIQPRLLWGTLAAGLALAVGLGVHAWDARHPQTGRGETGSSEQVQMPNRDFENRLEVDNAKVAELEHTSDLAKSTIVQLEQELAGAESRVNDLIAAKAEFAKANADLTESKAASDQELAVAVADRGSLETKLETSQQAYQAVETELTNLKAQRQQDLLHYASLEFEVNDLTRQLHDAQGRVNADTQYLASDRDIRELMGARQLYISDVVDVDQNGNPRKPFGRVFYTKGKSLIFYAFDLDQQGGFKEASIFQAWAREGSDRARPVSLGIFYVDSEANRRWVLKASDPKLLAEINTVFVTVEPKGGSEKPTGKPVLYAYLRTAMPNHP